VVKLGSVTIATRSSIVGGGYTNPVYLAPDRQGTNQLTVDSATHAVTRRRYLPSGQARGTPPTVWPGGDRGYIGCTPDTSTGLQNLGAREYNPTNGRFLSADPVLEAADPTQIGR
jgi:RHS repeat-associated protein